MSCGASCPGCVTGPTPQATDVVCAAAEGANEKIREDQLRRMAEQQGLLLNTSRCDEHVGAGYGLYWLSTVACYSGHQHPHLLVSPEVGLTLDGVEEYLTYGCTRAEIMEYLIRSYGTLFVEDLIKRLPQVRTGMRPRSSSRV